MFETIINTDIKAGKIHKSFDKTIKQLSKGNFTTVEVKKMSNYGLYRAKIDYENRLLFKYGRYNNLKSHSFSSTKSNYALVFTKHRSNQQNRLLGPSGW